MNYDGLRDLNFDLGVSDRFPKWDWTRRRGRKPALIGFSQKSRAIYPKGIRKVFELTIDSHILASLARSKSVCLDKYRKSLPFVPRFGVA